MGLGDGEFGEETGPGDDGELGALGEEPPFGLLVDSVVVEPEVLSEPCEKVPRLVAWSRVSSRAWLLKTRAVGAATPLAVPLPPPAADRPASGGAASERDVDLESRAASRAEPAPLRPAEAVEGDESEVTKAAPLPVPVEEDRAPPFEVVLCAKLSELAVVPRAALRRPGTRKRALSAICTNDSRIRWNLDSKRDAELLLTPELRTALAAAGSARESSRPSPQ